MGGYGLFGVITELELDMVPNALLAPTSRTSTGPTIGARFADRLASDPTIQMAYGRMDVALDRFFERGLLITYRPVADQGRTARGVRFRFRQPRVALSVPQSGGVRSRQAFPLVDRGGVGTDGWPATRRATR